MVIGGLQKVSLSDYPGKIAAIVFTRGCNFRCAYCHNPELVDPERFANPLDEGHVLDYLHSRRGQIQGVVVTGGEPTMHDDLPRLLATIKAMGFHVKLDTNGSRPGLLAQLLEQHCLDYLALDIKGPLSKYPSIAGVPVETTGIAQSIRLVLDSGLPYEMRTTYLPALLSDEDVAEMAGMIGGCRSFFLQGFRATKALDPAVLKEPPPDQAALAAMAKILQARGIPAQTR
jgi:pyruvate formate lyase activating enzyme